MALGACVVDDGGDVLMERHRLSPTQRAKTGHEGTKNKNGMTHG